MKLNISACASGFIFGMGLILGQMINPVKVLAFLDVAGQWDPTLALVMAGALITYSFLRQIINLYRKKNANNEPKGSIIPKAKIDAKLIIGSALFGIGWGLSGLCPGPALLGLTSGLLGSYVFVVTLFIGFFVFNILHRQR
ncbi:MAG: YeeE/YedE family protein [Methylococcales bacterium]|nr:YeeE/YedE family protein [Methylococcales bacterium]